MNNIGGLGARAADQEVVGFDISIDQVLFMDGLDTRQLGGRLDIVAPEDMVYCASTYHLLRDHANSLETKPPIAVVEQVFERWPQEVNHEDVVKAFLAKVVNIWDAG